MSTMTGKAFHVRKFPLFREQKVFDVSAIETEPDKIVARASRWAEALWNKVYLGLGDTQEAAMHRAEQRYGVPAQTFWALRYRKPKDLAASVYMRLMLAYEAECDRQEAKLAHELAIAKALPPTESRQALIAETEALLGPGDEPGEVATTAADLASRKAVTK